MRPFKQRHTSRPIGIAAGLLSLSLVVTACGSDGSGNGGDDGPSYAADGKTIKIGSIGWNENVVTNAIWKHILEENGYEVKITPLSATVIYQGLAQDDLDLFLDAWLPNTHAPKMEKFGDSLEKVSAWYNNGTLEWTVPAYVEDVNTIADLKGKAEMFNGRIVGIEPSAGITDISKNDVVPAYGLGDSYKVKISSTSAMVGALDRKIAAKKPVVVTLWHPHVAYTRYDLKDLEDPKGALGKGEKLWTLSREGFAEDRPEVVKWLKNFTLTTEQLRDLENLVYNEFGGGDEADKAVDQWAKKHQDLIKQWTGKA